MAEISNLTPVSGALTITLSGVAAGAYSAASSLVDNTATTKSYTSGWVRIAFGTALTAGAGTPYVGLNILEARDGTNLPNPPGTAATAPSPNVVQKIVQLVPSASFSILDFPVMDLFPFKYGFQVYNNSGVAFSGTITATLYRGDLQSV